jgi:predicted Fe-S protein YdhL (DUF1289 family)
VNAAGDVASPCVNVCRMDAANALCVGCFRTLDEIARWSRASDDERRAILAAVARRRDAQDAGGDRNR